MKVCDKDVRVEGRLVRIARLAAEGFEFLDDPEAALGYLRGSGIDIFTFIERLPNTSPRYDYAMEWDNVAALPVSTFEHWWTKQIDGKTRNMVRRAEKKGVVVREVPFDDALVTGIWEIYNECPVRQGRPFQHYGKDIQTVQKMSATFLETSVFIGAFLDEKLIGFVKLTIDDTRSQATVMHIISMIQHRDKSPTNALIAESVRSCEQRDVPYIVYSHFAYGKKQRDSLSDFKESNGFKRIDLPRYYVPLTPMGRFALRLGLQHSLLEHVPEPVIAKLREIRNNWYERKLRAITRSSCT
jgi:hypothetical protein